MQSETLRQAILKYGKHSQVDMAIEEMSELTKALLKERRNENTEVIKAATPLLFVFDIIEEIADVEIMIEQLKMIFDCEGQVEAMKDWKVEQLKKRIKDSEG